MNIIKLTLFAIIYFLIIVAFVLSEQRFTGIILAIFFMPLGTFLVTETKFFDKKY